MKKLILTLVLTFSFFGFAADLRAIQDSWGALLGALNGVLIENTGTVQYIPGYGLHFAAREAFRSNPKNRAIADVPSVVAALASSIRGLDKGDWVSVAYKNDTPKYEIVARVKPGQPETLEVWLDGVKQ